jgi:RHS repeat-associated protein
VDTTYTYSANHNNGRIVQQTDNSSGEQVTYQYDELNRLISAVTADNPSVPQWGQAFMYDGFGNLTDKSVTKGSAPVWHGLADPATNRASGYVYDANGNAGVSGLQYTYDIENRLTFQVAWTQGGESGYGYDPDNRRVYKATSSYDPGIGGFTVVNEEITFWGATGQRMGTYSLIVNPGGGGYPPSVTLRWLNERAYFGGRLIWRSDGSPQAVYSDRVGSVGKYFPYGEDRSAANAANGEKFATYDRESATGLDYAMNRYYDSGTGRFLTPDPYRASGGPAEPGSWNRYAYTTGDPLNRYDPSGLLAASVVYDNGFCPAQYSAWECYGEESGGDIFGRGSQSGVPQVWLVFDPLSGVIDDWDYANKLGTAFNISLSDDFFQGFVASGGAVLTNRGVYEIG